MYILKQKVSLLKGARESKRLKKTHSRAAVAAGSARVGIILAAGAAVAAGLGRVGIVLAGWARGTGRGVGRRVGARAAAVVGRRAPKRGKQDKNRCGGKNA